MADSTTTGGYDDYYWTWKDDRPQKKYTKSPSKTKELADMEKTVKEFLNKKESELNPEITKYQKEIKRLKKVNKDYIASGKKLRKKVKDLTKENKELKEENTELKEDYNRFDILDLEVDK